MGRLARLLLAVAALGAAAPAAHAGTLKQVQADVTRVRAVITRAASIGALTPAEASRYRASLSVSLRVARALDQPAKRSRFDAIAAQLATLAAIARRGDLTAGRFPALFRQLDANRVWFAAKAPPAALSRVRVAGDPLVYGYFPGDGLVLHPLFNAVQANSYFFAKDTAHLVEMVDALEPLAVPQPGGWVAWEYLFDYGGGSAPWRSGMAQGVMLQVLARTWAETADERYLTLARKVLPGFMTSTSDGGLLDPGGSIWWPLYAFDPGFRVLNGDLQVVISLYDYAAITNDPTAKVWADQGAAAALAVLPRYDTGAWSRYDEKQEATLEYHDLMTRQLGQLMVRTGDVRFRDLQQRFALYRKTPPKLTPDTQFEPARFYPAPVDGYLDRGAIPGFLDKRSTLTIRVTDSFGDVVATTRLGRFARGRVAVGWNGVVGGRTAPPGLYSVDVTATDIVGNRSDWQPLGTVEIARDETAPEIRTLRVGRAPGGRVRLRWSVSDAETPTLAIAVRVGNRTARLTRLARSGTATFPLRAPKGGFTAEIQIADTSGNAVDATRRPA